MKKGGWVKWAVIGAIGVILALAVVVPLMVTVLAAALAEDETNGGTCQAAASAGVSGSIPAKWKDEVEAAADASGVPAAVLAAQIDKESGWNESAVNSGSGAAGMAQFMPATWAAYGEGDPLDGANAITAMGRYMGELMKLAGASGLTGAGQLEAALGAYNWGPGNMTRVSWDWKKGPGETTDYVSVIMDRAQVKFTDDCAAVAFDGDLGDGEWAAVLPGGKLTGAGGYGGRNVPGLPAWAQNHVGLDFATPNGGKVVAPTDLRITGIYAPDGCVMAKATTAPHFGFAFCHLNDWTGAKTLKRGEVVGTEGTRASSVGVGIIRHLHFELYHPDSPDPKYPGPSAPGVMDPTPILRAKGVM